MSKEIKERNERIAKRFCYSILIFGCTFLPLSSYHFLSRIYYFSKYGLEKQGRVIEVVKTATGKGGIVYKTKLEIDHKLVTTSLRYNLPIGKSFSFLVMPDAPNDITLGEKASSMFDLYAYSVGGYVVAILCIGAYTVAIVYLPFVIIDLKKNKLFK
jgi:hypothetical protein